MTSSDHNAKMRALLEDMYLAGDNPRAQSGYFGDAAKWERDRKVIAAGVDSDGTFLDIGCASGHLMECMARWCSENGHTVEPHGVDLIESLVNLAKHRLPQWEDRIHHGDVMTWDPPMRFDYVRTETVYVPDDQVGALLDRLATTFVVEGGRVIVCSYGSSNHDRPGAAAVATDIERVGYVVAGTATSVADTGRITTQVAWFDA